MGGKCSAPDGAYARLQVNAAKQAIQELADRGISGEYSVRSLHLRISHFTFVSLFKGKGAFIEF